MRYRVNMVKPISNARRYEYLHRIGVKLGDVVLKGKELDEAIDQAVWREAHPGQNPIREWSDGVQEEREVVGGESDGRVRTEAGHPGVEGQPAVGGGVAGSGVLRARRKTAGDRVQAPRRKDQREAGTGDRPTKGA